MTEPDDDTIEAIAQFLWRNYAADPDDIGPLPFEVDPEHWRRDARAVWALATKEPDER